MGQYVIEAMRDSPKPLKETSHGLVKEAHTNSGQQSRSTLLSLLATTMSSNTTSKLSQSKNVSESSPVSTEKITGTNCSGDELWSVAFSNVGRVSDKPLSDSEGEIAKAIQAISGSTSTQQVPRCLSNTDKASFIKQLKLVQRILAMQSSPNCI
jgi:hypothetical protein